MNKFGICLQTMTQIEKSIDNESLIRVHKSHIINISKIDNITNNQIHIGDKEISIGALYKNELMKKMNI